MKKFFKSIKLNLFCMAVSIAVCAMGIRDEIKRQRKELKENEKVKN